MICAYGKYFLKKQHEDYNYIKIHHGFPKKQFQILKNPGPEHGMIWFGRGRHPGAAGEKRNTASMKTAERQLKNRNRQTNQEKRIDR